jgi:hypothetical protein
MRSPPEHCIEAKQEDVLNLGFVTYDLLVTRSELVLVIHRSIISRIAVLGKIEGHAY